MTSFPLGQTTLVYDTWSGQVIDGLALDAIEGALYWTSYDTGEINRLDLTDHNSTYEVVLKGRDKPRAIQIDDG